MQNDPENYLKHNNSVKSIADSIKKEEMISLLDSYPALKGEANSLTSELINNGVDAFNRMAVQIAKDSVKKKNELIPQIDFEMQEDSDKDILDRIKQQIHSIMENLTPEELDEVNKRERQNEVSNEFEYNDK